MPPAKKPATKKAPAKTAGKAPGKPASKAPKAAPARASKGGWRPRFEAMVDDLRAHKKVEGVEASFAPPATDAQIAEAERSFGRSIDAEIVAFYREMNGFNLEWQGTASDDERGHIHLQPIEKVFGDWKNVMWFDREGGDRFRSLLPFDFFVPEACMAFDASETPLRVHFHYCGEEQSATGYGFAEYLERLLASRGYFYWVQALCEDEDQADSEEAETFLANVPLLFRGVDKRLFRPKAVDFGSLSLEELVSRVKTDEDSEAPKALAMEVASRPASAARLRDLLADPSPEPRIRALRILAHYGLAAMPFLGQILRSQMGLAAGTPKSAESAVGDAASSIFRVINGTSAGGLKKAMAAGAKELEKETDVRPVALLLDSTRTVAVDPSGHLHDVALRAFLGGVHIEAAVKALAALDKQEEAAAAALEPPLPQGDAELAARTTALAELYGLRDETAARVRALLETNLRHASDEVATAAAIALLAACEEAEYEVLGLFKHPSAAVREALVRELVSWLGCSGRHVKEKRLLAAIAADEREETRIREMARSALGA